MANISSAYGKISVTASTKEDVDAIFKKIDERLNNKYVEYFTNCDLQLLKYEVSEDGLVTGETYFDGCGRWTFSNNIANFGRWMKHDALLTALTWKICFEYKDEECGCDILYEAVDEINHEANEDLDELIVNNIDCTNYDLNPYNLMTVMNYSDEDIANYYLIGADFVDEYENLDEYEERRLGLLEKSINSCLEDMYLLSEEEAKEYVLEQIPCLNPVKEKTSMDGCSLGYYEYEDEKKEKSLVMRL